MIWTVEIVVLQSKSTMILVCLICSWHSLLQIAYFELNILYDYTLVLGSNSYNYVLSVKTGTNKGQTARCKGKAQLRLNPSDNSFAPLEVVCLGRHLVPGKTKTVNITIPLPIDAIKEVEVWLERPPDVPNVSWFVEHMTITEASQGVDLFFPFHRWVTMIHQVSGIGRPE